MEKRILAAALALLVIVGGIIALEARKAPEHSTLRVGDEAPDFRLMTLDGREVRLSDYEGPVLLNFFATWCPPCREEMPLFEQVENATVIAVNLQESVPDVAEFVDELDLTYPVLLDPESRVKARYNVRTQPTTFFIEEGRIVEKKSGPLTRGELTEHLGRLGEERGSEIRRLDDGTKYLIHPSELRDGGPGKDGIPSIDEPRFISAQKADWLSDEELVLGLEYEGEVRAYPLQVLVWHELVNDVVAGDPLLISYCPLCGTGIAFNRTFDGRAVEFGVSGKLYNSDLIMYDRETDSYWQQLTGRAIIGPRTGERLEMVPLDTVPWREWREAHPETRVLSRETGYERDYGEGPYGNYAESERLIFPVGSESDALHRKAVVYGIEVDGAFKAYPLERLPQGETLDTFAGRTLRIVRDGSRVEVYGERELAPVRSFWFAWFAFHPGTALYTEPI